MSGIVNNTAFKADTATLSVPAREVLAVIAGAVILMIPAIINGCPFLFSDSGDYLVFTPQLYRSPFYGLFIFFFHWDRFIWGPVIAQALIASHLVWLTLGVLNLRYKTYHFWVAVIMLTVCSSLPFFVGYIMADIFTADMFLVMYLIAFHFQKFGTCLRLYILLLGAVSTAANIANLTMGIAMLPLLAILLLWCGYALSAVLRRMVWLSIPLLLTIAATLLNNTVIHHTFSLSPAGQSFVMANLIEYGPADKYLKEACPSAGYKICAYVDQLPMTANTLLWQKGIFIELGGFEGMKDESRAIVMATIKKYPLEVARVTLRNVAKALVTWEPGEELEHDEVVPTISSLLAKKFGARTENAYLTSMEMQGLIPHTLLRNISYVAVALSLIICVAFIAFYAGKDYREVVAFIIFLLSSALCDAILCASLSGVYDRYQARVTWLIVFTAVLLVLRFCEEQNNKNALRVRNTGC